MDFSVLKRLAPILSEEGTVVNKTAMEALEAQKALEAAQAAKGVTVGSNDPLTSNPFAKGLLGIDRDALPAGPTSEPNFQLVGGPQNKGFTLGPAGEISRPPVPYKPSADAPNPKGWEWNHAAPGADSAEGMNLPALSNIKAKDGEVIDISPIKSKWDRLKQAAPYVAAGGAGIGAALLQGDGSPSAQAAKAPTDAPKEDSAEESEDDGEESPAAKGGSKGIAKAPAAVSKDKLAVEKAPDDNALNNLASIDKYKSLQDKMNQDLNLNQGAKLATDTIYAMSGRKENPFAKSLDEDEKNIKSRPEQYEKLVGFQKEDPKSAISKTYQKMAAELGMAVAPGTSAAEIEKAFPQIVNLKTREDLIEAKKEIAKDNAFNRRMALEDRATQRQKAAEEKQEAQDVRRYDTYGAKLGLATSRTLLGQAQSQAFSVDRVDALLNGHANPNDLTPQEVVEVAKGLDRVISGGVSTLEGSKALNPGTARQWIADQMQKIRNIPQGAQSGAFLSRIHHNLQNEKNVAVKQAALQMQTILSGSGDLAARDPDRYKSFLAKANVHPDVAEYLATGRKPETMFEKQRILQESGVHKALQQAPQAAGQPAAAPKAPSGDMVKVQTSDGKVWNIPKANLSAAQKRDKGLQVIQ